MFSNYEELVAAVADEYRSYEGGRLWHDPYFAEAKDDPVELSEINLWTYWQGLGVRNPKLLLIGLDWGSLKTQSSAVENVKAIAKEDKDNRVTRYLDGSDPEHPGAFDTDWNLVKIFKDKDTFNRKGIDRESYDDLFFTNLYLGYRPEKSTGKVTTPWSKKDTEVFLPALVDILDPDYIVCLGQDVAKNVYESLTHSSLKGINRFNDYIDRQNIEGPTRCGTADFFAMPHPGYWGTRNRKGDFLDDWKSAARFMPDLILPD